MASGMSQRSQSQSTKDRSQNFHLLYRTKPEDCLVGSSGEEDDAMPSNQLLANQANPTNPQRKSTPATNVVEIPHGSRETPHGSQNPPQRGRQEDEEEEDNWNFLTQFIGSPASSNRANQNRDNNVNTANLEAANFRFITICFLFNSQPFNHHRSQYLEDTEVLDRATAHLTALTKAESRGKTPAKLTITIKPMVIEKEDPQFKADWAKAIAESEKSLVQTLKNHLSKVSDNVVRT